MKYFTTEPERDSTCYHEWAKGEFDGIHFWQPDSLLIHDDVHWQLHLEELFRSVIPDYDPLGEIVVSKAQWEAILEKAQKAGGEVRACIQEADAWVQQVLAEHGCFTMIGM